MTTLKFGHSRSTRVTTGTRGLQTLLKLIGFALLLASVIRELRLPGAQRTWHGLLFAKVPYDLRFPSPSRIGKALWNPADRRLVVPTAFGVGWTLNLGAVGAALRPA